MDIVALGKRVDSFLIWSWPESLNAEERTEKLDAVMELLLEGTLRPPDGETRAAAHCLSRHLQFTLE